MWGGQSWLQPRFTGNRWRRLQPASAAAAACTGTASFPLNRDPVLHFRSCHLPLSWSRRRPLRFWITKNSEVSIHEQLVRQVILAILSEDLPAGRKLPSIRALARRCQIHSNTVSSGYHHLLGPGMAGIAPGKWFVRARHALPDTSTTFRARIVRNANETCAERDSLDRFQVS
jgi:DNA-binding transcriptional regulator YhcF (GntR family)